MIPPARLWCAAALLAISGGCLSLARMMLSTP